jgi:hypothetical protein
VAMRRSRGWSRFSRGRSLAAALLAAVLVLAACGGDDDDDDVTGGPTTTAGDDGDGELTDSFRGVTATAIKVGIVMVDYSAIADFVDFKRGDQQETAQILVDWINENGGIGGRKIDPVFVEYPPIPGMEPSPLTICTQLTEDEQVFAVVGVFIDFTGDGQLCLSAEHDTVHIGHELQQPWIDEADPGLLLTPGGTADAAAANLIRLLDEEGMLEGRKVAVLGDNNAQNRIDDVIVPGLEDVGADLGPTAVLTITGTDTSAAQAQLDSFIERWKTEDVDTIFMAGLTASAKQFVDKIVAELPDVLLIADSASVGEQAQDAVAAGGPNPYEGMLSIDGESRSDRWAEPNELLQDCIDAYEEAKGTEIIGPDELKPGPDGKLDEVYVAVEDFCDELMMLKLIAEKAGPNLTNETWTQAVHDYGSIVLPTADVASLCEGKYTANDQARIVEFDSSEGENGDFVGVTELADASGGICT